MLKRALPLKMFENAYLEFTKKDSSFNYIRWTLLRRIYRALAKV